MKAALSLFKKLREFRDDISGSVMVVSALMIFVLVLVTGATIDYTRLVSKKSKMDAALDSAILAAGVEMSRGTTDVALLRQTFENFFLANLETATDFGGLDNGSGFQVVNFSANPNTGEISGEVSSSIDATLMRIAGYDGLDISSSASSVFEQTDVEVAMVLDVTGSMRPSGKLDALQAASKDLIDILLPRSNTRGMRIGIVPYASSVNAGRYAQIVTNGNNQVTTASLSGFNNLTNNVPTNDCVSERNGREAATDASYRIAPLGSHRDTVNGKRSRERHHCPEARIQPLTNNSAMLKTTVNQFIADGFTAGHIGISWAYYMLSENWRTLWNADNDPAAYSADVQKIAIIMTDGEFNTVYEDRRPGTAFGGNRAISNARAIDLCNDMKAAKAGNPGIIIYSIAFQAPSSAETTLRNCANTDTADTIYFYSASNGQQLREAFRAIAASIGNLRITG